MLTLVKNNTPVENPTKYFEDFKSKVKQCIIKKTSLVALIVLGLTLAKNRLMEKTSLETSLKSTSLLLFLGIPLITLYIRFLNRIHIESIKSLNSLLKISSSNKTQKNALIIIANPDENGWIDIEKPSLLVSYDFSFLSSLAKTHNLFIHQVGSISELKKDLNEKVNFYDTLLINGHGSPNAITLDHKTDNSLKNKNLKTSNKLDLLVFKVLQKLIKYFNLPMKSYEFLSPKDFNCLKPNARIILKSCSTGKGGDCIAKKVSLIAKNRLVFAPKKASSHAIIVNPKTTKVKIFRRGLLNNYLGDNFVNNKDLTVAYKNGKRLPMESVS